MKKYILLINISIFILMLISLSSVKSQHQKLGLSIGIANGFNSISAQHPSLQDFVSLRQNSDERLSGVDLNLIYERQMNEKWAIQSGMMALLYSAKAFSLEVSAIHTTVNPERASYNYLQGFHSLGIPLYVKYTLFNLSDKFRFQLLGGADFNYVFSNQFIRNYELNEGRESSYNEFEDIALNSFNLALVAGAGIAYQFTHSFSFQLQPIFRQFLINSWQDGVDERIGALSVNFGWMIKIGE